MQLQQGGAGEAVIALQSSWRIIDHDGVLGRATEALVRDLQEKSGITSTGSSVGRPGAVWAWRPVIDAPLQLRRKTS